MNFNENQANVGWEDGSVGKKGCLLCKQEGSSSSLQNPCKNPGIFTHVCNSSVIGQGGQRQEDHSGLLAASLAPNPVRNPVEASRWPVFCQL